MVVRRTMAHLARLQEIKTIGVQFMAAMAFTFSLIRQIQIASTLSTNLVDLAIQQMAERRSIAAQMELAPLTEKAGLRQSQWISVTRSHCTRERTACIRQQTACKAGLS